MPLPTPDRASEYAAKAAEALLREVGYAPEMRVARKLRSEGLTRATSTGGPSVLFMTPRDWAAHVQYEAVLAHALKIRGADVRFLTCGGGLEICDRANTYEAPPMPCRSCTKYVHSALDAHGHSRTALADRWDDGSWPELDQLDRESLADVVVDDLPLGSLVEIPLKWFLCAADLDREPLAGRYHRAFLRSARRIASAVDRAFDEHRPDVVVLLNGLFLFEGIAWAVARARGIDVVTYERAFLKETLVFSRGVPAGFYDFSASWDPHASLTTAEEDQLDAYLARRRSGGAFDQFWDFEENSAPDQRDGRLAVLFTNLTWDTAVIGRDAGFEDIRRWLDVVIGEFRARTVDRLVIRVHPSEKTLPGKKTRDSLGEYLHETYPDLPPNIQVIGADDLSSSYTLMDACDVGLVYSSTTGLELALAGKPVIVAADVHYRGKGFTLDVSSPADFRTMLDAAFENPDAHRPQRERVRRYAHFFFFKAPIAAPGVSEPLPGLARLTVSSLDELEPSKNPELDRICDGILSGRPFA